MRNLATRCIKVLKDIFASSSSSKFANNLQIVVVVVSLQIICSSSSSSSSKFANNLQVIVSL
ncbi:hypothetical protein SNOG_14617 [Parastagonospora nodorum SN15]|uniref:Uncharacterized protein n=1 Tax=Phaeosphaeria nodorum (strain SN15 / ATCC MYA-4574 / FGSC 10173) TaxID=321614 RepID=Q0U0A5_PHANO|nr:hypothetical protein SNOG_14617 [Parastagonospora nodorum SN15]EAT77809.2 hypothetical protein SNOG_14617 [Parastagonospora nodorum SN15]